MAAEEFYRPKDGCDIAQQLFDDGLIFMVNQNVLHHYGFSLGAEVASDGRVIGLVLVSGQAGVYFDGSLIARGRKKMRKAGYLSPKVA